METMVWRDVTVMAILTARWQLGLFTLDSGSSANKERKCHEKKVRQGSAILVKRMGRHFEHDSQRR